MNELNAKRLRFSRSANILLKQGWNWYEKTLDKLGSDNEESKAATITPEIKTV